MPKKKKNALLPVALTLELLLRHRLIMSHVQQVRSYSKEETAGKYHIASQKVQAQLTYTTEPLSREPSSVNVDKTVNAYLPVELAPTTSYQMAYTQPKRTLHFPTATFASKTLLAQHEFFTQ